MKAIAQRRETATLESLLDRVLCHDVRDGAGKVAVAKGARLTSKAAETLLATPWEEIHLLALEPGDLHEEEGGRRLGAAAVGEGVEVKGYGGGQWTLTANRRGLLKIRRGPLAALRRAGAQVLIVAGASALDPLDPVFGGLTLLGARMERHGAPAHPGSLLWLALWDGQPVLGMPTCGMFSQATTFDLVLPQILAGEHMDNRTIAELGHGGLLSRDMAYRFPPYRVNAARGELE